MKKILFTLVALAASVGCQREEPFVESENGQESSGPVFTAQVEAFSTETRTGLDGNSLVWSSADQLAIFHMGNFNGTAGFDLTLLAAPAFLQIPLDEPLADDAQVI